MPGVKVASVAHESRACSHLPTSKMPNSHGGTDSLSARSPRPAFHGDHRSGLSSIPHRLAVNTTFLLELMDRQLSLA